MHTRKSNPRTYYPNELKEYSTGQHIYVSKTVTGASGSAQYFLFRPVKGEINLYVLKEQNGMRLFAEDGDQFVELRKDSFREQISNMMGQDHAILRGIRLIKFRKGSLTRYLTLYNKSYTGYLPVFRRGIFFGITSTTLVIRPSDEKINLGTSLSPQVGVFIELPLGMNPHFFVDARATFQQNSYSKFVDGNVRKDFLVNTSSVAIPVLFKFRSTSPVLRTSVAAGPSVAYYLRSDGDLFEAKSSGTVLEISKTSLDAISKFQAGGCVGVGIEYSLTPTKSVGIDLRYTSGFGFEKNKTHSASDIQLQASLSF
jgi:hypothetical protein